MKKFHMTRSEPSSSQFRGFGGGPIAFVCCGPTFVLLTFKNVACESNHISKTCPLSKETALPYAGAGAVKVLLKNVTGL